MTNARQAIEQAGGRLAIDAPYWDHWLGEIEKDPRNLDTVLWAIQRCISEGTVATGSRVTAQIEAGRKRKGQKKAATAEEQAQAEREAWQDEEAKRTQEANRSRRWQVEDEHRRHAQIEHVWRKRAERAVEAAKRQGVRLTMSGTIKRHSGAESAHMVRFLICCLERQVGIDEPSPAATLEENEQ